jgi:hypothetical protein
MAQNVSHRPPTAEVLLQSHASPCTVCGGPRGTGRGFLPFRWCNRLTCTVTALLSGGQGVELENFRLAEALPGFKVAPRLGFGLWHSGKPAGFIKWSTEQETACKLFSFSACTNWYACYMSSQRNTNLQQTCRLFTFWTSSEMFRSYRHKAFHPEEGTSIRTYGATSHSPVCSAVSPSPAGASGRRWNCDAASPDGWNCLDPTRHSTFRCPWHIDSTSTNFIGVASRVAAGQAGLA